MFLFSLGILKLSKRHKEQDGEEKCKLRIAIDVKNMHYLTIMQAS